MEKPTCKRCGRTLKSPESIKRGYGLKCFKIIQLQENSNDAKLTNEINFLKCEINMIKRQLKQSKNIIYNKNLEPIERIKKDLERPERDSNKVNFNVVIKELKVIFNNGDLKKYLTPIQI